MSNLTQIEQALLQEYESLASAFEDLAAQQSQLSEHSSARIAALTKRQSQLETLLLKLSDALAKQNASTTALIDKAKRLNSGWR